jgi:histone-lysine N-methyltransferase SETMAR
MLTSGVVFLHENERPHTAARTRALLEHVNWELSEHSPYSPDRAPSYCHLFTYLKNWLRSQRSNNNVELIVGAKTWPSSEAVDFFATGIQTLIPRYDKCHNSGGDYVEK